MNINRPFFQVLQRWQESYQKIRHVTPKYIALANMIVDEIKEGKFNNGDKLPPHREVADQLKISIQTASSAYRDIEHQGYVRCEVGRGSYVFKQITEETSQYIRDNRDAKVVDLSIIRAVYDSKYDVYKRQMFEYLQEDSVSQWMHSCRPIAGFTRYREVYANWAQSVYHNADPNQLLLINGCTQGVFTALASIVHTDDVVLTENITDHGVIGCSRILRFILKGLPIDEFGIIPEAFEKACRQEKIKALVCTPTFNNPTNSLMGLERRQEIADIALKYGVFVVEDDVLGQLLEQPLLSISSLIPDLGFYITSFSKVLFPGARTGFLICPKKFFLRAESVIKVTAWMATPLVAEMVTQWIENGQINEMLDLQRGLVAKRQAKLFSILKNYIKHHQMQALSAWLTLPDSWQPIPFAKRLYDLNVAVTTSDPFLVNAKASKNAVRICVGGNLTDQKFVKALNTIHELLENQPVISSSWY